MDLRKCRTCFTNLESNDLYQRLNSTYKNSKLSLAEKLKICVPTMDLQDIDGLFICMQCSMHLETAFTFHMTCLKAEEEFQKYIIGIFNNTDEYLEPVVKLRRNHTVEDKRKSTAMFCHACNVSFSTNNIFNLHMKVMHNKYNNIPCDTNTKELKGENSINKEQLKGDRQSVQMVFLQTTFESSKKHSDNIQTANQKLENNIKRRKTFDCSGTKNKSKSNKTTQGKKNNTNMKSNKTTKICKNIVSSNKPNTLDTDKSNTKSDKIITNAHTLSCRFCIKKFSVHGQLTRHLAMAHKDKCNRCSICDRYYTNAKEHRRRYGCQLQNVKKIESMDSPNIRYRFTEDQTLCYIDYGDKHLMCVICRKECQNELDLKKHITGKHKKAIKCKSCSNSFPPSRYCIHIGNGCSKTLCAPFFKYTSKGECICPVCNKTFLSFNKLTGHLSSHSRDPLVCKICKKKFDKVRFYCQHLLKGCQDVTMKMERCNAEFVEMDQEYSSFLKTSTEDPLANEDLIDIRTDSSRPEVDLTDEVDSDGTLHDKILNKNIKIEPTELLDETKFLSNQDSQDNDTSPLFTINENYTEIDDDVDVPDIIYVVPGYKPSD